MARASSQGSARASAKTQEPTTGASFLACGLAAGRRPSGSAERALEEAAALRLQTSWRGHYARRALLPRELGADYSWRLLRRLSSELSKRSTAKAFVAARNRKIAALSRELVARRRTHPLGAYGCRGLAEQLRKHQENASHRLRAALILQSFWRGQLARLRCARTPWPPDSQRVPSSCHVRHDCDGEHFRRLCAATCGLPTEGDGRRVQAGGSSGSTAAPARSGKRSAGADPIVSSFGAPGRAEDPPSYMDWLYLSSALGAVSESLPKESLFDIPERLKTFAGLFGQDLAAASCYDGTGVARIDPSRARSGRRKVVIYYSDTGGGHRASATALRAALERHCDGDVEVEMTDFIRVACSRPFTWSPECYQHLGSFPSMYKWLYDETGDGDTGWAGTRTYEVVKYWNREPVLRHLSEVVEAGVGLIVSVHPLINHLLTEAIDEIFQGYPGRVPVVTIVTDLGSAHCSWFNPDVDALFVPSGALYKAALALRVPEAKVRLCGLPVREGFWSSAPRASRADARAKLGLPFTEHPSMVLLMGGGGGFGSLYDVAVAIGQNLVTIGFGQLVVICGQNEEVKRKLEDFEWPPELSKPVVLGFVPNIDEYMSAADILVTKAGPGSIAEAMIKGLPCLLTSFVPGQEEGNVDFVTEARAGEFVDELDPWKVAEKVAEWFQDPKRLRDMSRCALQVGKPDATLEIAKVLSEEFLDAGASQKPLADHGGDGAVGPTCAARPAPGAGRRTVALHGAGRLAERRAEVHGAQARGTGDAGAPA